MHYFWLKLKHNKLALFCLILLAAVILAGIFAPLIAPHDPTLTSVRMKYQPLSFDYPLGTDNLGRCVFSRLLFGIRTTVFYSLLAMTITIAVGMLIGLIAGYFRGRTDEALMRICDVMLSFPGEVMIFALVGVLGPGIDNMLLAIVLVKWAWYARMIRSLVMQYRNSNYVMYAAVIACPPAHIMRKHLIPSTAKDVAILATADIGAVILTISALSFLGLGVQPPQPEWGNMLSEAKNVMMLRPMLMLPAGIAIVAVVAAFNVVGDFLRDVFDPVYSVNTGEKHG